jgi:integrase
MDPSGAERSKAFARKVDAEAHLTTIESAKLRGEYVDPRLGKITYGEYMSKVTAQKANQRPSTRARDAVYFRSLILPWFEGRLLESIELSDIKAWLADLQVRGYASATIRKAYQLFASVPAQAVRERRIARNPCADIRRGDLPTTEPVEMRFLSQQEIGRLTDAIDPRYRVLVLTAAFTGLRFGELAALRVKHLDMLRRSIRVEEGMTEVEGNLSFGPLKTKASRRIVSMPKFLAEALDDHLSKREALRANDLVFTGEKGAPLRAANFRQRFWMPAVDASVGQPLRFHDLRHSHAALLIAAGLQAKVIQRRLGHSSIKTTFDVYGHVFEGLDVQAAAALDNSWEGREDADRSTSGGTLWDVPQAIRNLGSE